MQYLRVNAQKSREIAVTPEAFWAILVDWGALMSWIPKLDENPLVPITNCELLDGQTSESLPCTRRVYLQNDGVGPAFLDETLRHADHETKRLYYTFAGVGPGEIRNYHATTFVDRIDEGHCRVTCASQFDVPENAGSDMKDFIEAFYDSAIIDGIAKLVQTTRAKYPSSTS